MSRNRSWQFTFNNYKEENVNFLKALEGKVKYIIFGKELGDKKKTPHLQGYVVLRNAKTLTACKKFLGSKTIHLEIVKGTPKQNIDYCSKEDKSPYSFGEVPKPGRRIDLEEIMNAAKEIQDYDALLLEYANEDYALSFQQMKVAEKYSQVFKEEMFKTILKKEFSDSKLRAWQKTALEQLEKQNDRQVLWIVDKDGNKGKTYLGKYLCSHNKAFVVTNGGSAHIAYAYNYERYVVFDFVRSKEETINYGVIEAFKDGRIFSSKYQSTVKHFPSCKVIIFSNFEPDESKLSEDRWDIIYL